MPLDEVTLADGTTRKLGNLMPAAAPQGWPLFGADPTQKQIPRDQWDGLLANYDALDEFDPFLDQLYVHDQDGVGQCNADSTTLMAEYTRAKQGLPFVKLSAADLYHRINGGSDRGSLLEDAVREMTTNGVGTAQTSGTLWKQGHWKGAAPAAERLRFRALEVYLCPTFNHCYSAVLQGYALSSGIMWYDSYTPDRDGWLPAPRGGAGGHAIMGYKPTRRNGVYGIWHQNSWGTAWGKRGRFVIPEAAYSGPVGGWWACRVMTDEGVTP